jgi:hypothetical protein
VARIRLTKKLAPKMNGVDVSRIAVGEIFEIGDREARQLIASGWAEPVGDAPDVVTPPDRKTPPQGSSS